MTIALAHRRVLARRGRPMTLRRRIGTSDSYQDVTSDGYLRSFKPQELTGGLMQGDAEIVLEATPLAAANWPVPPRKNDFVVVDGRTWTVQGATPRAPAGAVVAWHLWVRGG